MSIEPLDFTFDFFVHLSKNKIKTKKKREKIRCEKIKKIKAPDIREFIAFKIGTLSITRSCF